MNFLLAVLILLKTVYFINCSKCRHDCYIDRDDEKVCGFNSRHFIYKIFPNECMMASISKCLKLEFIKKPIAVCLLHKNITGTRRFYKDQSCPAFCPEYYRPVCGVSKIRDYKYRTFINGCYLDMLNCRGDEDSGYIQVDLKFCQNHLMKNIFKEQMVITNQNNFRENY
ncbi:unnamed protein product [Parnassius mnemosyne]|uniref:Uncharacterized protein n=1 Tax=Parnassius mnemosyne TaxID=213953 RepID=A0AAV1KUW0_9NEOP